MQKEGNRIPPKVHTSSITKSKDTEMPKNSKIYFKK
jgi:hypothetical protein